MSNANDLPRAIQLELTKHDNVRLFRNNVGTGWAGRYLGRDAAGVTLIANARPLHAGLVVGSSDLIGWRTVTITEGMVGRRVAVFAALEAKTGGGRLTVEQANFIKAVKAAGGFAGETRTVVEAALILDGWEQP